MSLDDLMNSLESSEGNGSRAPVGGVRVVEQRGPVQLKQVPKEELPRNHPSVMGLQERGGHYDVVQERKRDESELQDLISGLDSLGGPPPRERPISRPPPTEMPPPPPAGTMKRVESYQPAALSPTNAMPVREAGVYC